MKINQKDKYHFISFEGQFNGKIAFIKQKIVAIFVLTTLFGMVFTAIDLDGNQLQAANVGDNSSLYQNITAGDLTVSASDNITFGAVTAGATVESPINVDLVNVTDFRGVGLVWSVTGYSSAFAGAVSGSIPNTRLNWNPAAATQYNGLNGADNTQIALGALATLGAARTFANGSALAAGEFRIYNALLNLSVLASDITENYNATLTLTAA